jgi:hypothetical protein
MPRVNIEGVAFGDGRFKALGRILGTTEYDALGRMAHVWRYCTDKQTAILAPHEVNVLTDATDLAAAIVRANLAEELEDGTIRIRGAGGRIEWMGRLRENAKKGGAATASQKAARRQPSAKQDSSPLALAPALSLSSTNNLSATKGGHPDEAFTFPPVDNSDGDE